MFHRGYTEGFMFNQGKLAQNIDDSHKYPEWEFCGQVLESKKVKSNYQTVIAVHNTIKAGDQIEIIQPPYNIIKIKIKKMIDEHSGKILAEAHGGAKQKIMIETNKLIPKLSLLRRKLKI